MDEFCIHRLTAVLMISPDLGELETRGGEEKVHLPPPTVLPMRGHLTNKPTDLEVLFSPTAARLPYQASTKDR